MKIVLLIGYIINLVVLNIFYMHMFQLNSYFFKKQFNWIKRNLKKLVIQLLLIIAASACSLVNNMFLNILGIIILLVSIYYNKPKSKSKISLKYTNRVKRMLVCETLISVLVLLIPNIDIIIKIIALNFISPIFAMIVNAINFPIEWMGRRSYYNKAKKILQSMPNLIVIGVTGSYGKTSVKNFLYKLLSSKYEVLVTPKNYNTTMGVVKTITENLKATHQIFICEMGATKLGDIKEICDLVNPTMGVITSIGPQHLESFKSIENIVKTKFELADTVEKNNGTMFFNYTNEYIVNKEYNGAKITYGIDNDKLDYNGYNLDITSNGIEFNVLDKDKQEVKFKTKLIGKHNIVNIMGAIAVANHLGVETKRLSQSVKEIQNVDHRLQVSRNGDLIIIDDSYNSNPVSSKSALDTLNEFAGTKIVVTPGLIELGNDDEKYNSQLGRNIAKVCDYVYLVGKQTTKYILKGLEEEGFDKDKIFIVNSPQEAVANVSKLNLTGKINVLLENDLPDNYNL